MSDALTTFNLHMQAHMKNAENRFSAFNAKVGVDMEQANKELRRQIAALEDSAAKARSATEASAAVVKKWVADSVSSVEGWKSNLDIGLLAARAERADHYAKAASEVAIAGVDAAERAALDARLAHSDVQAAKASKGG